MYQENQCRTFNIWRDGDLLHIFLTVPSKKYNQYNKTIEHVKRILGLNFEVDFDNDQFYFTLNLFQRKSLRLLNAMTNNAIKHLAAILAFIPILPHGKRNL